MGLRDERIAASEDYWHNKADLFSGAYSAKELLMLPAKRFLQRRMDKIGRFIRRDEEAVALDVGCGSGELASVLAGYYKKIIGVDYSQIMIDLALKSGAPANVEFHQADCTQMPLADNSVDCIFSLGLLDYLPNLDAALREFRRVSAPGGRFVVTVPKSPSLFAPIRWATGIRSKLFKLPPLVNVLSRRQLAEVMGRHGLKILDVSSLWTTMWIVHGEVTK